MGQVKRALSKDTVVAQAQAEVNKELADKYAMEYKGVLREVQAAELVLSNAIRKKEDLECRMELELG